MAEASLETRFQRKGTLIHKKLLEYLPALIVTNMSTFLLLSVDGLVVGNLIGAEALSAVNIFYPVTIFIGAATAILSTGASSALSTCMGKNKIDGIRVLKKAVRNVTIIGDIIISVLQIPLVYLLIALYHLPADLNQLTWLYAIGIMISTPFSVISTVATYQLQIVGKSKSLMWLTAVEGLSNLLLNLLFISVFHMGVMGASMGTACACLIRCTLSVIYISRRTDLLKIGDAKVSMSDVKEIISSGLPEASNLAIAALQNYCMMSILVIAFGSDGGVIKGVVTFCYNIVNIFMSGVQGSMRPLSGLLAGSDDRKGLRQLVSNSLRILFIGAVALTVVIELIPGVFYQLHGITDIPDGGILSLRLGVLSFALTGVCALFRQYFTNRKDKRFTIALTWLGNATLPLFAFILLKTMAPPFIWLSSLFGDVLIVIIYLFRYRSRVKKDFELEHPTDKRIYLSVDPDEAVDASHLVQKIGMEGGFPKKVVYRVKLCMEEMVAYVAAAHKKSKLHLHLPEHKDEKVDIQIDVLFSGNSARVSILDDGERVELVDDLDINRLTIDNYVMMEKIATTIDYQYILEMNFFVLTFQE